MSLERDMPSIFQLREHGRHLSQIIAASSANTPTELARIVQSAVRDLMPDKEEIHHAIIDACMSMIRVRDASTGAPKQVLIANLKETLHRTYNSNTVNQALLFAEGFLSEESDSIILTQPNEPKSVDTRGSQSNLVSAPGSIDGLSPCNGIRNKGTPNHSVVTGSFMLVILAMGILGAATLKPLEAWNLNRRDASNVAIFKDSPKNNSFNTDKTAVKILENHATPSASSLPNAVTPAARPVASSTSFYEAGTAAGGQIVRIDLSTIRQISNRGDRKFVYYLGREKISSIAKCAEGTWVTLPEAETHSPKSEATQRMLNRVCSNVETGGRPEISSSGVAIVFDPPSNIRTSPNGSILCSVTSRDSIPIQGRDGDWYKTDYCGSLGFIHKGQIRF